jgi:hypothetical protein
MSHEYANPNLFADAPAPRTNTYDKNDRIERGNCIIAGPLKIAMYRVRDPQTDEWSKWQFHMTFDNMVTAVMSEEGAKLFARFVNDWQNPPLRLLRTGDGVVGDA